MGFQLDGALVGVGSHKPWVGAKVMKIQQEDCMELYFHHLIVCPLFRERGRANNSLYSCSYYYKFALAIIAFGCYLRVLQLNVLCTT
jgi:hypothetical protein